MIFLFLSIALMFLCDHSQVVYTPGICGTEGHGQWAWRAELDLGLGILEVYSILNVTLRRTLT